MSQHTIPTPTPSAGVVFRCLVCDTPRENPDTTCEVCGAAAHLHVTEGGEPGVFYTPHRLNQLVSAAIGDAVADILRARAAWHRARANTTAGLSRVVSRHDNSLSSEANRWHWEEADALERLAARELAHHKTGAASGSGTAGEVA